MRPLETQGPVGRRLGLRAKLVTAITLLITLAGTSLAAFFFVAAREEAIAQLQARGRAVAEALAHNSRVGVFSNDAVGLRDLVEGARRHADVVYVMVSDVEGRIIAETHQESLAGLELSGIAKTGVGLRSTAIARVEGHGGATVFDVAAPVSITRQDRASRGGEMSLFGLVSPSPSEAARREVVGTAHVGMSMAATDLKIQGVLTTSAGVLVAVLVFGLALAFLIAQRVVQPINAVITTSQVVASGDLAVRLPVKASGDELNDLAMFFNDMTSALDDNRRELTELARVLEEQRDHERALGDIAVAITGTHSIPELAEQLFVKLADHLKAPAAIFYQVSGRRLVALAGLGVARDQLGRVSLRLGEGVAGQAAERRARVIVTEVPEASEMRVPVLGEKARLDAVVAQPLIFQDQLLGVVEIGLFRKPDRELLAFLDRVTDQLAVAVNNLRSYQRTQELAEELRLRGEELAQQNEKLERAYAEIQRANQHKSAFLANMSHELRTPLNSILGFTRLVIRKAGGALPERQVENLQRVEKSGTHLLQLINDILDISKVEAGRMDLVPESFALRDLISEVMSVAAPLVGDKPVALVEDVRPDIPQMDTDKTRLRQIILNIVSNAVKFTQQGEVRVSASFEAASERAVLAIHDTGIGISQANLGRVFEPFTQADESTTRQYGGTGLGLALVTKMVELLGGEVHVESEVGRGSKFTLLIPVHARQAPADAAPGRPKPEAKPVAAATPAGALPALSATRTVVVIEDNPNDASLIQELLSEEGYRVVVGQDGDEGRRLALAHRPFAITVDIMMPGKDGWQVIRELKQEASLVGTPIVVVSIVDNKRLGYALGVSGYLTKPVAKDDLLRTLAQVAGHPRAVVVVDDDPEVKVLLEEVLNSNGFSCRYFRTARQALAFLMSGGKADVIIVDLMMPEVDGFELIHRLKSDSATAATPIIVVTAKDLTPDDRTRLNSHVVQILRKGEPEALCGSLAQVLRSLAAPRPA